MNSLLYIIIIILLLLIILYQYLRSKMGVPSSSNKVETTIEKTTVTDMKIENESAIKLDLKPVVDVKSEDYDTMVGKL